MSRRSRLPRPGRRSRPTPRLEFYAGNPNDTPDYTIGEELGIYGAGLRFMYDPDVDGDSYSCYTQETGAANPHHASGVGNHFFYLLARGSGSAEWPDSPTCDGSTVAGIGNVAAGHIWFRALSRYMGPTETYSQAAAATLSAATDLYGRCGDEYDAVLAVWSAVDVDVPGRACPEWRR